MKKRKRSVLDRYHYLEFEKPGRHRPDRCRSHVLKAHLKQTNRLIGGMRHKGKDKR